MKGKLLVAIVSLLVLVAIALPGPVLDARSTLFDSPPTRGRTNETLNVPFENGNLGVQTVNSYSGRVLVKVRGIGQAAGTAWSDAFYIFTDDEGNPVEPWHPTETFNWTLWINGGPVDDSVNQIPAYNPDHVYVFHVNAPEGPLTFAVGDSYTIDNTGEYQIVVRDLPH